MSYKYHYSYYLCIKFNQVMMDYFDKLRQQISRRLDTDLFEHYDFLRREEQKIDSIRYDQRREGEHAERRQGENAESKENPFRYSCLTRNLYQNLKKHHFKFLQLKGIDLSQDRIISALLQTNTMSRRDYSYLYKIPKCKQAFEEMFSSNYLETAIKQSSCQPKTIENILKYLHIFETAFRHPHKKFPNVHQRIDSS